MHQMSYASRSGIFVEILEQPTQAGVRFRYKCEGRSAGCIRGASSSDNSKSFPTIKVHGYRGPATCLVSCVTKDGPPYYPHPHNLVGKHTADNGICCRTVNTTDMTCSFPNLGIQCVKKKEIKDSLLLRKRLNVDPFGTGFSHCDDLQKINLSSVRLCFQVFIADSNGKVNTPLKPVVSEPIFDHRAMSDLAITKLSHSSSSVTGGQEIILLCDLVNKDDIEIIFYEEKDGQIVWSARGQFLPHHVHRKAAISFTTPAYRTSQVSCHVSVFIQLRRPSDGIVGKPRNFTYVPLTHDPDGLLRKRQKFDSLKIGRLLHPVQNEDHLPRSVQRVRERIPTNQCYQAESFQYNLNRPLQSSQSNIIVADRVALQTHFISPDPFNASMNMNSGEVKNSFHYEAAKVIYQEHGLSDKHSQNVAEPERSDQVVTDDVFEKLEFNFDSFEANVDVSNINLDSILDSPFLNCPLYGLDVK